MSLIDFSNGSLYRIFSIQSLSLRFAFDALLYLMTVLITDVKHFSWGIWGEDISHWNEERGGRGDVSRIERLEEAANVDVWTDDFLLDAAAR